MALGCTVDYLENNLSAKELAEWIAFYNEEPFGYYADFFRAGIPAAVTANVHRDPKKTRAFSPLDFMPPQSKPATAASGKRDPRVLKAIWQTVFAGRIKKKAP